MSRTRVPAWTPPFKQALRMVLRPALAYLLFTVSGTVAFMLTVLLRGHGLDDLAMLTVGFGAGIVGVLCGQLCAILRVRGIPIFVVSAIAIPVSSMLVVFTPGIGTFLFIALYFFAFAFPCGFFSLQHRWELLASFWPAVGWIGAAITIINDEGRVAAWEHDKSSVWMVVPLMMLGAFLVLWLFYLASKQSLRVELWQALSGAAGRRVMKKTTISALPRKNVLPILVVALVLFAATALLAPYLWRTATGEREGQGDATHEKQQQKPKKKKKKKKKPVEGQGQDQGQGQGQGQGRGQEQGQGQGQGQGEEEEEEEEDDEEQPPPKPELDKEAIARELERLANAAKESALHLWPLLLLFLFYRPAKRGVLLRHLRRPLVPTPPSERVEYLWEYVRIAAQDAGVMPLPSDSIEDLLGRIERAGLATPAVFDAASIYARTRYGFTVHRGDPDMMRGAALRAARDLRARLTTWQRVKILWRPLA